MTSKYFFYLEKQLIKICDKILKVYTIFFIPQCSPNSFPKWNFEVYRGTVLNQYNYSLGKYIQIIKEGNGEKIYEGEFNKKNILNFKTELQKSHLQ